MEQAPKMERDLTSERLSTLRNVWGQLQSLWQENDFADNPLGQPSPEISQAEEALSEKIVELLNCSPQEADLLYAEARRLKDENVGNNIRYRAAVHVTNICRANCLCCPMRRDNLHPDTMKRATTPEIVAAADDAYQAGYKDLFIQGGEDVRVVPIVVEALKILSKKYSDIGVILNLGNLSPLQYKTLYEAGARKYVIKHETANPKLHEELRQEPIEKRVQHMLYAKQAGFEIGAGNILGIPGQTDRDLADDVIFFGRSGIKGMLSSTTYTPSDALPEPYKNQPSGDWEKTKRFIAVLRILFPSADIHAPSNADSPKLERGDTQLSGQSELILSGANEMTVEFTSPEMAKHYGLYDMGTKRHKVDFIKIKKVEAETKDKK